MQLALTTKYALQSLILLAQSGTDLHSVHAIAEELGIPRKYLGRLMPILRRAGLVQVLRGKSGGYGLARSPGKIKLASVVDAVQGLESLRRCMLGLEACSTGEKCRLHAIWAPHQKAILATLERVTLADLAARIDSDSVVGLPPLGKRAKRTRG